MVSRLCFPTVFVKNLGNRTNNLYPMEWKIKSSYLPDNTAYRGGEIGCTSVNYKTLIKAAPFQGTQNVLHSFLNKIFTFDKRNRFLFCSLIQIFHSLNKIGCTSAKK